MSKASEYAAALPLTLKNDSDGHVIARVTSKGELFTYLQQWTPSEALRLAEWIQETFGEGGG